MKKKLIFIILIILVIIFLIYIFYPQKCNAVLDDLDAMTVYNYGFFESNLENSMSEICEYSVDNREHNYTYVTFESCDLDRVKNGLNNPESLTLNEIKAYIRASDSYTTTRGLVFLKEVCQDDFHTCNPVKSTSATLYRIIYLGSISTAYIFKMGLINTCLSENSNLTEWEKKECVISVLNAEKAAVNYYSNLDYEGDVQKCILTHQKGSFSEIGLPSWHKIFISSICKKMIDYRKKLVEKIKESNIDYNQKFFLLSSLYLQDNYIGKEEVSKRFEQIVLERINPKYQILFKPVFF